MALSLEHHYHQEFHLAKDTNSCGLCGCWRSNTVPSEYLVTDRMELKGVRNASHRQRILANQRLSLLVQKKFDNDELQKNDAFEMLKLRINDNFSNGDPVTSERLAVIVNTIYEVKKDISRRATPEPAPKRRRRKKKVQAEKTYPLILNFTEMTVSEDTLK